MIFAFYLFFFLYLIFSSFIHIGVHAQSEDGSTNPIDTKEPPATIVCLFLLQPNQYFRPPRYIFATQLYFFFCFFGGGLPSGLFLSLSLSLQQYYRVLKTNFAQINLAGCVALVIYDNNAYHRLCWDAPVTIYPHSDGIYRITIYTGFPYAPPSPPEAAPAPAKTHPTHAQYYEWWGYRNLFVGLDGCLRVGE